VPWAVEQAGEMAVAAARSGDKSVGRGANNPFGVCDQILVRVWMS
jgi:hypothetical protein